ncbi:programmed cell death protein 5 isoform X1 [Cavia porcellus]
MCVPAPPQSAIGGSGLSPAPWQWQGSRIRAGLVRPECCERLRSEPPSGGCVRWFRVGRAVATAATPRQSHYGGRGVGGAEEAEAGRTAGETRGELAVASFAQPGGPGPWRRLAVSAPHAKDFSAASWPEDPNDAAQQEAKHREAEMRNSILAQVLDQSARARLSNLALVKPEKTKAVENYLIQMARYGQLSGKVSEQGLIEILEKVSQQTEKKTTVKFNRRKVMDSDEDDDY